MEPKDIVVFLENAEGSDARLNYAAALAKRWQAHLIATYVINPLHLDRHAGFAIGAGLTEMLNQHRARTQDAMQESRARFEMLCINRSFTAEWRVAEDETIEGLMLHARHAGLAIVGPPLKPDIANPGLLGLANDIIFASGRPTLCLPANWSAARIGGPVVVGWNASREATRAITAAMPFLIAAEEVHVVVAPDARLRRLYGQEPGADITAHLARYGVRAVLDQRPGDDAGAILLERCRELHADMLVMGAVGRSRISEFVFGGATRKLLDRAELPLLLSQ